MFVHVVPLSQLSSRDLLYVKCYLCMSRSSSRDLLYYKSVHVVPLSQLSSRDLDYPLWDGSVPEIEKVERKLVNEANVISAQ